MGGGSGTEEGAKDVDLGCAAAKAPDPVEVPRGRSEAAADEAETPGFRPPPRELECSPCDRDAVDCGADFGTSFPPAGEPAGDKYYQGSKRAATDGAIHCEGFATRNELTQQVRGLCLVMVGLPGRGKSFISRKTEGFLKWQNLRTETFNVGKYRRECEGATESGRADFFDSKNVAATLARKEAANRALDDLFDFLDKGGDVAIFDATNTTNERREMIIEHSRLKGRKYRVVFIEIICDDPEVLMTNFRNKVLHSPDFAGLSLEEALADLIERVKKYEDRYEPITDDNLSYIKLYNMSSKVMVNKIYGSVAKSLMPYLMGVHIGTRPIWIARTGHVPAGGAADRSLTPDGHKFAARLGAFVRRRVMEFHGNDLPDKPMRVLSSTVPSAVQTVMATLQAVPGFSRLAFKPTSSLSPLDRGRLAGPWFIDMCNGADHPPWDELQNRDRDFYAKWEKDPLRARWPGGESYYDVISRVESCLLEVEMSTRPILCVSHLTVMQVLVCYFTGTPVDQVHKMRIPDNCVVEITPTLGGSFEVEMVNIDSEPLYDMSISSSKKKGSSAAMGKGIASKMTKSGMRDGAFQLSVDTKAAPGEPDESALEKFVSPKRQASLSLDIEDSRTDRGSPIHMFARCVSEGDEPELDSSI
mmetsp:Transcript_67586/g.174075  ORF Transcript_67586/g.174075 Transcript_67586/m.174075 type:complete len:644 (-) Transcript_67586:37-1968(-)